MEKKVQVLSDSAFVELKEKMGEYYCQKHNIISESQQRVNDVALLADSPFCCMAKLSEVHLEALAKVAEEAPKAQMIFYFLVNAMGDADSVTCSTTPMQEKLKLTRGMVVKYVNILCGYGLITTLAVAGRLTTYSLGDLSLTPWKETDAIQSITTNLILAPSDYGMKKETAVDEESGTPELDVAEVSEPVEPSVVAAQEPVEEAPVEAPVTPPVATPAPATPPVTAPVEAPATPPVATQAPVEEKLLAVPFEDIVVPPLEYDIPEDVYAQDVSPEMDEYDEDLF